MATINEIKVKILQKVFRLPAGQTASDDDLDIAGDAYEGVYQMLLNDSLVDWAATEDIPTWAVLPIVAMSAYACSTEFGLTAQDIQILAMQAEGARKAIARQLANDYEPSTTEMESF